MSRRKKNTFRQPVATEPAPVLMDSRTVNSMGQRAAQAQRDRKVDLGPAKQTGAVPGTVRTQTQKTGRPRSGSDSRDTMPVNDSTRNHAGFGDWSMAGWNNSPSRVKRMRLPLFSFENIKWSEADLPRAVERLSLISPDVAMAKHLIKRLANTTIRASVKKKSEDGSEATEEDPKATAMAKEMLKVAGQMVVSDIPDAMGSLTSFVDNLLDYAIDFGEIPAELVLDSSRTRVTNMVAVHPLSIEIRRDPDHPGMYLFGQRRWDVENNWRQLNPNLFSFQTTNGELHGVSEFATAAHIAPLWMGYFGKLQIFLHRAAFGFLDGVVKTETLQLMWKQTDTPVRELYDNDFMTWATAMVEYIAQTYKDQEEADPDAILAHLDLMEIKAEATGKASFPMEDAKKVVKQELYASLKTPGELLGEPSTSNDKFTMMKIRAYHEYLKFLQGKILTIINRFIYAGLQAAGYDQPVEVQCEFDPIDMDDRLTQAQALQLEQLCAKFLRDENVISQNQMARRLIGGPAIAQAPLAKEKDPNGASAPDPELMASRAEASDSNQKSGKNSKNGAASGPSFGGKKQTRDSGPRQGQDKKMKDDSEAILAEWASISPEEKVERIRETLALLKAQGQS